MQPPQLGAVLVTGPLDEAVRAARAAGAEPVYAAFPEGSKWLNGASPEPPGLETDSEGRVRTFRGNALPLPEGLRGLVGISADQLAGDGQFLRGRTVVVLAADPVLADEVFVPGVAEPVDRGRVLAVALGAKANGAFLRSPPGAWVTLGVVLLALPFGMALRRLSPERALMAGGAVAAGGTLAVFILRLGQVDLPLIPVLALAIIPAVVRYLDAASGAFAALDLVAWRAGGSPTATLVRARLEGRAALAALHGDGAVVWDASDPPAVVARSGRTPVVPELESLPTRSVWHAGFWMVPVEEEGGIVGAIGLASPASDPLRGEMLGPLAGAMRADTAVEYADVRASLAVRAVERSAESARWWEMALSDGGLIAAVFSLGGDLMVMSRGFSEYLRVEDGSPLVGALGRIAGGSERDSVRALRTAVAGRSARVLTEDGRRELLVTQIVAARVPQGFLVQVVPIGSAADRSERARLHEALVRVVERIGPDRAASLAVDAPGLAQAIAAPAAELEELLFEVVDGCLVDNSRVMIRVHAEYHGLALEITVVPERLDSSTLRTLREQLDMLMRPLEELGAKVEPVAFSGDGLVQVSLFPFYARA